MKKKLVFLALAVVAGLLSYGCADDPPTAPTQPPSVNVSVNVNQNQGGTAGTGSTGSGCTAEDPAPTSVTVSVRDGSGVIPVSNTEGVPLDATPHPKASDNCNLSRGVSWAVSGEGGCQLIGNVTSFTPKLKATIPGESCTATAQVLGAIGGIKLPTVP